MSNDANMQKKLAMISAKRESILSAIEAANKLVQDIQQSLSASLNERNRLQNICIEFGKGGEEKPPLARLGSAVLATDALATRLIDAEKAQEAAIRVRDAELAKVNADEAAVRHEIALAAFHEKVSEFENIVQRTRLAYLSDEIRTLAAASGVPIEQHSPLISQYHLVIGGYPIRAWASAPPDSANANAATQNL